MVGAQEITTGPPEREGHEPRLAAQEAAHNWICNRANSTVFQYSGSAVAEGVVVVSGHGTGHEIAAGIRMWSGEGRGGCRPAVSWSCVPASSRSPRQWSSSREDLAGFVSGAPALGYTGPGDCVSQPADGDHQP